jgi:hypothetical protein
MFTCHDAKIYKGRVPIDPELDIFHTKNRKRIIDTWYVAVAFAATQHKSLDPIQ